MYMWLVTSSLDVSRLTQKSGSTGEVNHLPSSGLSQSSRLQVDLRMTERARNQSVPVSVRRRSMPSRASSKWARASGAPVTFQR